MATPKQQESGKSEKQQQHQSNIQQQRNQPSSGLSRRERSYPSSFHNSPFSFMRRFSEEMDRLFEDFTFGHGLTSGRGEFGRGLWSPQVETFERQGQLVIRADLPGLSKDDVNVEMSDDAITISGERHNENEENREGFYRSERSYGSFYRQIPLPEGVDANDAKATFNNGVLEITLNASQLQSRNRRLEISEGGAQQPRTQSHSSGR